MAGLCLAIGLLETPDIDVQIYEAAAEFSEVGLGVNIAPNAQRALAMISPKTEEASIPSMSQPPVCETTTYSLHRAEPAKSLPSHATLRPTIHKPTPRLAAKGMVLRSGRRTDIPATPRTSPTIKSSPASSPPSTHGMALRSGRSSGTCEQAIFGVPYSRETPPHLTVASTRPPTPYPSTRPQGVAGRQSRLPTTIDSTTGTGFESARVSLISILGAMEYSVPPMHPELLRPRTKGRQ